MIVEERYAAIASKGGEPIAGRDLIALLTMIGIDRPHKLRLEHNIVWPTFPR